MPGARLAASSLEAWAFDQSALARWNGASWLSIALPAPTSNGAAKISGLAVDGGEVWLLAEHGRPSEGEGDERLYRWNGASWVLQASLGAYARATISSGPRGIVTSHAKGSYLALQQWSEAGPTLLAKVTQADISRWRWQLLLDRDDLLLAKNRQLFRLRF